MWSIMQTKSDAEPWWFLDGWQDDVIDEWTFSTKEEAIIFFKNKMKKMMLLYPNMRAKRGSQFAFWNEEELLFCDSCDEDLQLYHGFLILNEGVPYTKDQMSEAEISLFDSLLMNQTKKTEVSSN